MHCAYIVHASVVCVTIVQKVAHIGRASNLLSKPAQKSQPFIHVNEFLSAGHLI